MEMNALPVLSASELFAEKEWKYSLEILPAMIIEKYLNNYGKEKKGPYKVSLQSI